MRYLKYYYKEKHYDGPTFSCEYRSFQTKGVMKGSRQVKTVLRRGGKREKRAGREEYR
jgi:hypothetical protein